MTPRVSIILPCSPGHASVLGGCLDSLRVQRFSHMREVIVVNSGDSASVAQVARQFDALLVAGTGTRTAGSARNVGVEAAQARILAFIDADCIAEPGWLESLYSALSSGQIAVGGPVLNQLPLSPVAVIDNLMQFVDQAPGRCAQAARELPGCNMAMTRQAYETMGGFPGEVSTGEDTLFSQDLSRAWPDRVRFLPGMRIRHRGRTSIREFVRHQRNFGFARGRYGLNISRRQQRLGRMAPASAMAALRRFGYLFYRTAQWNIASLPRLVMLSPLLVIGLFAWAQGFTHGCRWIAAQDQSISTR